MVEFYCKAPLTTMSRVIMSLAISAECSLVLQVTIPYQAILLSPVLVIGAFLSAAEAQGALFTIITLMKQI